MIYVIEYSKEADKTLRKWKKSNPQLFKKATKILMDIMAHPRTGLGHPEALIGGNDVTYSRHITVHDRIIYDIYDDRVTVLVVQAEEHYNDNKNLMQNTIKKNTPPSKFGLKLTERALRRTMI